MGLITQVRSKGIIASGYFNQQIGTVRSFQYRMSSFIFHFLFAPPVDL